MSNRKGTILLVLLLLLAGPVLGGAAGGATRTVKDMAGRQVTVPRQIHKIYCMNPACAMMIYTLAPDRLMDWSLALNRKERYFLAAPYDRLPGRNPGMSDNVEQLAKIHPDVVMFMANALDRATIDRLQRIQEQSHIPTYLVEMRLRSTPQVYEQLGELLGVKARAAELARYCRNTLQEVDNGVRTIPMSRRPRVYYAGGVNGLQTLPVGAPHAEPIEVAGGINVAKMPMTQYRGTASIEQILGWNPDIILVATDRTAMSDQFYQRTIWSDPLWRSTSAVRNHAVYEIPSYPFGWVSPPASVNRILGTRWLANLFYPERFNYDMRKETKRFYALFYRRQLTEGELNGLLVHAHR